jgi:hypothetical protein
MAGTQRQESVKQLTCPDQSRWPGHQALQGLNLEDDSEAVWQRCYGNEAQKRTKAVNVTGAPVTPSTDAVSF